MKKETKKGESVADYALQRIFGHSAFRGDQRAIVSAACSNKDVFVVMPTGGGKSICYQVCGYRYFGAVFAYGKPQQLPAVLQPGLTVVVSPLLSLIQDQIVHLVFKNKVGVPATFLSSEQTETTARAVFRELYSATCSIKLLYVTPEKLNKSESLCGALRQLDSHVRPLCYLNYAG